APLPRAAGADTAARYSGPPRPRGQSSSCQRRAPPACGSRSPRRLRSPVPPRLEIPERLPRAPFDPPPEGGRISVARGAISLSLYTPVTLHATGVAGSSGDAPNEACARFASETTETTEERVSFPIAVARSQACHVLSPHGRRTSSDRQRHVHGSRFRVPPFVAVAAAARRSACGTRRARRFSCPEESR